MIKINCDIGERDPDHPTDVELMRHVHIANIACGGHAGDEKSVEAFSRLAEQNGVEITAHLSYPDRENFGRTTPDITIDELLSSLQDQIRLMPTVKSVKFHGALYNDSVVNSSLATALSKWLKKTGIQSVITPFDSELARSCLELGLNPIYEAFAERNYAFDPASKRLTLVSRKKPYASITDCGEALEQSISILQYKQVNAVIGGSVDGMERVKIPLKADTLCIHSDSDIALELAVSLAALLKTLSPKSNM